jgi:hypothetical protein
MYEDQILKQVDSRTVEVYEEDAQEVLHTAFSIRAEYAHDAIGTEVPTTLTISNGDRVTLTVSYRAGNPAAGGAPFIFPITAGTGWEGGFNTYYVDIPDEPGEGPPETEEEAELDPRGPFPAVKLLSFGPPTAQLSTAGSALSPVKGPRMERKFKFTFCHPHNYPDDPLDGKFGGHPWNRESKNLPQIVSECHREDFEGVYWGVSAYGKFHYIPQHWVWLDSNEWDCHKWGEEQPAEVECGVGYYETPQGGVNAVHGPIDVLGLYRWPAGHGQWAASQSATCLTEGGRLFPTLHGAPPYDRPMILEIDYVRGLSNPEPCPPL